LNFKNFKLEFNNKILEKKYFFFIIIEVFKDFFIFFEFKKILYKIFDIFY